MFYHYKQSLIVVNYSKSIHEVYVNGLCIQCSSMIQARRMIDLFKKEE